MGKTRNIKNSSNGAGGGGGGGSDGRGKYTAMDSLMMTEANDVASSPKPGSHVLNFISTSSNFGGSMSSADGSFPATSHPTSPLLGRSPMLKQRAKANRGKRGSSTVQPLVDNGGNLVMDLDMDQPVYHEPFQTDSMQQHQQRQQMLMLKASTAEASATLSNSSEEGENQRPRDPSRSDNFDMEIMFDPASKSDAHQQPTLQLIKKGRDSNTSCFFYQIEIIPLHFAPI